MKKNILMLSLIITQFIAMGQENTRIKSISVFKNGQSFVIKEVKARVPNGEYRLPTVSQALFGTYWFAGIKNPITRVTSCLEEVTEIKERKANSFLELLHANKGREIQLVTQDNNTYKGVVEDFDLPEEINSKIELQQRQLSNNYQNQYNFDKVFIPTNPILLLKIDGKWTGIEPAAIKTLTFPDKPSRTTAAHIALQKPVITIHFTQSGLQYFDMMYLQNGLSWRPVYQLQLVSETKAILSLQAEISNDVEDIRNTDMDIVVGAPNFSKASTPTTLLNFTRGGSQVVYDRYNNMTQLPSPVYGEGRRSYEVEASMKEFAPSPDYVATENEDLYFYTLKNVNLLKGEKAHYPVFNQPIRINHFYKSILSPSTMNAYRVGVNDEEAADQDNTEKIADVGMKVNKVDHFMQVYNNTENPFTSGTVLILQKATQKPVAQDILKFTPKGASSPVFITTAPDILLKEGEKMVSVKKEVKTDNNGYKYALVTVKGTIHIHNSKSKPINMQVQKSIWGRPVSSTVAYRQSLSTENQNEVNQNRLLDFELEVAAGQKKSFQYTYELFIRE